jgi:hypothetical protein
MKIVKHSRFVEVVEHTRQFTYPNQPDPYRGYGFTCDAEGNVDEAKLYPAGLSAYRECLAGAVDGHPIEDRGVQTFRRTEREPAIGRCDCGAQVTLGNFTNTCSRCEADYNQAGQRLAPRAQWGEETGEHWTDCI